MMMQTWTVEGDRSFLLGLIAGLIPPAVILGLQWLKAARKRRKLRVAVFDGLLAEAEAGVKRYERIATAPREEPSTQGQPTYSASRIYVAFGDRLISELPKLADNSELLILFHTLYAKFDQVNFNADAKRFGNAAGFAEMYLKEVQGILDDLTLKLEAERQRGWWNDWFGRFGGRLAPARAGKAMEHYPYGEKEGRAWERFCRARLERPKVTGDPKLDGPAAHSASAELDSAQTAWREAWEEVQRSQRR